MSRRGGGRFSLFAEDGADFGALPAPRSRIAAGAARASMDLDQLRGELHRRCGADADSELGDFVSDSRLRFQQLLSGGKWDGLHGAPGDRFQQLMGSTASGATAPPGEEAALPAGRGNGACSPALLADAPVLLADRPALLADAPALLADRPALLTDAPALLADAPALLADRPALLGDRPALLADNPALLADRPSLLGGRAGPLSERMMAGPLSERMRPGPLSERLNSEIVTRGGTNMATNSMVNSSSSVMNASSSVMSSSSSAMSNSSRAVVGSGDRSVVAAGGDDLANPQLSSTRQQTFQQSRTASNTTFSQSLDGGPSQSNTTRLCEEQQTRATTENGATNVAQQRAQKLESATVTSHNGETQLALERAQVAQAMEASSHGDGVTDVREEVQASGAVRHATFEDGDGGPPRQLTASGEDFSARAQVDYVHEAGDGPGGGQFRINSGGPPEAGSRRPPLWRFSAFGPLIQPPSGRIRGQVTMQTSHSMFNCQAGALPRFAGSQYTYEDTFEVSESESDDDDLYLPAPARRRQLGWRHKPALTLEEARPETPSEAPSEAPSEPPGEREADVSEDVAAAEEEERRRRERLHKIASELLVTERKYVQELHLIDQIFHFRVDQENRAHHMFNNEITAQMFSNVKSIHQFHKDHMLPQLESRLADWENDPRIGDIMKTCAPFLKMYTEFVKSYDNAMNLINAFFAKCPRFAAIMNEIHEMEECGNLPLQHHMIVPIQRVPRYELLLKDYLKRLPENSPDYEDAKQALELVTHAATHSNDTMKRVDKFKQLLEIQENISGGPDLVSPTRQLVKQGKICKISARSGDHQERYLFLFSDLLLLCSPRLINNRIISGPAYRLRAKFSIEGLQVMEGDNLETVNTFYITGNQKNVELYTQTADEKAEWLEALCSVMTSFYERRASLKSDPQGFEELGKKAPVMLRQEGVSRCMECESQFGMMRRKHGCHACGIVVCGKCSSHKVALPCEQNKPARVCNRCHQLLAERAGQGGDTSATTPRRESILDVSYTRGKGVLDVPAACDSLLSGYLQLRSRKAWSRRWFCLREDFVLYSYQAEEALRALTATPVPGFTVTWGGASSKAEPGVADKDRERTLKLTHVRKSYLFLGEGKEDIGRWVAALQKAARAEALPQTRTEV
ncbi:FYVE, RhoGEF and PH domain-containing protein 3-like [Pollicipes pollicipes]|uniref:FYVE, RhoGEF and PH domain-containing protein 3-like n=1 Tax=Pollicipes pollicipes TaxID=41117 RepID=UPI0018853D49|nr:FYVE, RhoGEF and PH domain-containing protein 3-like [Pollicipes pollicipes]